MGLAGSHNQRNLEAIALLALFLSFSSFSLYNLTTKPVACFPGDIGSSKCPISPGTTVLGSTYVIQTPGPNNYVAFLTGSVVAPFFSENNFSRLMNNDILASSSCTSGCSIQIQPGNYNLNQTVTISNMNIVISGFVASRIIIQNVTFSSGGCAAGLRSAFCVTGSGFVAQGFQIDDAKRQFLAGITGDDFTLTSTSSNILIQSMQIYNASSNAISVQGTNTIITLCTLTGPITLKTGGNYGVLAGGTSSRTRIFLNSISGFNGSDVAGISTSNGASYVDITSNDLFQNQFGILSTWGKFITISSNKIHNNFEGGIILSTLGFGSVSAGPIAIVGNQITDNSQEPGTSIQCNNLHCSGIELKGTRPIWDSVSITGNAIKDTQTVHTQLYDIYILSTQYNNLTITGNALGPSSSGLQIAMTVNPLKTWIITANPGFNPQPIRGPLTAGATPFTYTNNDAYMEQIELITIGDMTAFNCRGIANIIQVDAISPVLNTLDTCIFTYVAVAPTYDVLPMQG